MKKNESINVLVLLIVVFYAITLNKFAITHTISDNYRAILTLLSSFGVYRLLITSIYYLLNNSQFFLKIYLGKNYLHGIWTYTYTLENDATNEDKLYFGIWNINQNLEEFMVKGYGIDDKGNPRSDVRSVSQLIKANNAFDIVNSRTDKIDPEKLNYSTTTLHLLYPKRGLISIFKHPLEIRAETVIYGGVFSGKVHSNVKFIKHEDCSESEVRDKLIEDYCTDV